MKIKYSQEQLESMSYGDIAYLILKEKNEKMKTINIFKLINKKLGRDELDHEEKIADFFTLLATDKRFIQLDKGYWDLKENHTTEININEVIEETDEEDIEFETKINLEEEPTDNYYDTKNMDEEEVDNDFENLVIIDDIDEEE